VVVDRVYVQRTLLHQQSIFVVDFAGQHTHLYRACTLVHAHTPLQGVHSGGQHTHLYRACIRRWTAHTQNTSLEARIIRGIK